MPDPYEALHQALADRYELQEVLGEGGMGTVYLARDLRHGRNVAIKTIHPHLTTTEVWDRFEREIRITAHLQHPNILPLLDSGVAGETLYYVMPYVEGESLGDQLGRQGTLPEDEVVQIGRDVASALDYAHRRGIVHRDIKPANIMLTSDRAVVADFGISKAVGEDAGTGLTQSGALVGTPAYMPPEQYGGEVTGRSDIYALGAVLYQALTGRRWLLGTAVDETDWSGVDPDMRSGLARALQLSPEDRWEDAGAFRTALGQAGALSPETRAFVDEVRAREATISHAGSRTRPAPGAAVAAGGGDLVESARPDESLLAGPAKVARTEEDEDRKKRRVRLTLALAALAAAAAIVDGADIIRAVAGWFEHRGAEPSASQPSMPLNLAELDPHRIAVLYFDDQSESGEFGHYAAGFTGSLIQALSQVPALEVISLSGVKPYRNADVTVDSIVRALRGPGTLIEGSVIVSGDRMRVNVQMIDAATNATIDSRTIERPRTKPFALLDDLSREVSLFLRERLGEEIWIRRLQAETENPEAWGLVQRAELTADDGAWLRAEGDNEAAAQRYARADSLLGDAGQLDPEWLTPILARGWVAAHQAKLAGGSPEDYDRSFVDAGLALAERALALAPTDPRALELRGTLYGWIGRSGVEEGSTSLELAFQDLEAAVTTDPSRARAWAALCELYVYSVRFEEARVAIARALEADAFLEEAGDIVFWAARAAMELEDFAEAVYWTNEGYRRFAEKRGFAGMRLMLFATPLLHTDSSVDQAWQAVRDLERVEPTDKWPSHWLKMAAVLAAAGLRDSAESVIRRAHEAGFDDPDNPFVHYYEAKTHLNLGDRQEALRLLGEFLEGRPDFRPYMAEDWWFRPLYDDSAFVALVAKSD